MSTEHHYAAAPREGKTFSRVVSTAVTVYEVPDICKGAPSRFHAKTAAMQINFGDASVSVTADQVSTAASTALTVSDVTGMRIAADGVERFTSHPDDTHFAVIASATALWTWTIEVGP